MSEMLPKLPARWELCELQDVAEVRLGRQRSPKNHQGDNMVPYLRAANVTWDGLDLSDVKEMNFTPDEVETYALREGDILVSEASGSASEVGKPAIWRGELAVCCIQNTVVRVRATHVLPAYLMLVLREAALSGRFAQMALGVGIHHLGAARLSRWPVPLPPIEEQLRIVDAGDRVFSELREGLRELEGARSLTAAYLKARLRVIDDFDAEPLAELADIRSGLTKGRRLTEPANDVPYLRAGNLGNGALDLSEIKTIPATDAEVARFRLESGDVLLVEGSGSAGRLGQGWVWEGQIEPCLHQNHVFRARPSERIRPRFLAWALQAPAVREHLLGLAKTTSGLNTISRKQVSAVPIPLPDLVTQDMLVSEFDQIAEEIRDVEAQLDAAAAEAANIERSLLHTIVSGRIVAQAESDTPALEALRTAEEARRTKPRTSERRKRHEGTAAAYT